jgi:hypothetical protein
MGAGIQNKDPQDILIIGKLLTQYLRSDAEFKVAIYREGLRMAKALLGIHAVTGDDRRTRWEEHPRILRRLELAGLDSELRIVDQERWNLAWKQLNETLPKPRFDEGKQQRDIALGLSAPEPEQVFRGIGFRPREVKKQPAASFNLALKKRG